MTRETFGTYLREKRRESGITQRALAKKIGVDFSYISKLENDRLPPPSADTVTKICEALEVDCSELLALTGKIPSEIQSHLGSNEGAQKFLREAIDLDLSSEEWESITVVLKNMRGEE